MKIMAARSNALSEIARFWLQECHGFLLRESVPVKMMRFDKDKDRLVGTTSSDIDFVATSPARPVKLLERIPSFKNAIVETKDERDYDYYGADYAKRLRNDFERLNGKNMISKGVKCEFHMLREEHHEKAEEIFGSGIDFLKIFIFHHVKEMDDIKTICDELSSRGIYVVTSEEMLSDIKTCFKKWRSGQGPDIYISNPGAGVRNSLAGDILDMLITYHEW
jgi:hypothetical protein